MTGLWICWLRSSGASMPYHTSCRQAACTIRDIRRKTADDEGL